MENLDFEKIENIRIDMENLDQKLEHSKLKNMVKKYGKDFVNIMNKYFS